MSEAVILSWDVGIIALAYCILHCKVEYPKDSSEPEIEVEIYDWDKINLINEDEIELLCEGFNKAKNKSSEPKKCDLKAKYTLKTPHSEDIHYFCKKHLLQHEKIWTINDTMGLFGKLKQGRNHTCCYLKKSGDKCDKSAKYRYSGDAKSMYLCTPHYNQVFKKKTIEFGPRILKKKSSNEYSTANIQLALIRKLDELAGRFQALGVTEVVIENQPSHRNPRMKSISNALFIWFMMRGYIDKFQNLELDLVRFMCPSNKLKIDNDNTLQVFRAARGEEKSKKKYRLTKDLAIEYTRRLLEDTPIQIEFLDVFKKQDDLCDAYLQGRYYLEYIRKWNDKPLRKADAQKGSGSKRQAPARRSRKKSKNKSKRSSHD